MGQIDDAIGASRLTRRGVLGAAAGLAAVSQAGAAGQEAALILHNARITTLDPGAPEAAALAIADGRFLKVGTEAEVMPLRGAGTTVIDAGGRRVIPGLIDSHLHIIRGGLNYNMELRWDGVPSLADGLRMLKEQAQRTPAPQWVRVVGGFTEHQFAEKRLPTLAELNEAAPDTPVFILHLYDRALLNRAALRAVGYTRDTPEPAGGMIERDAKGEPTGLLLARPNALILYATLAKGPKLPVEWQVNSTRHFMRELNRLGVTSAIDAGGGYQNYPEDYQVIEQLAAQDQLTVRIAYNLFTQKPKEELSDFRRWTGMVAPGAGQRHVPPQRRRRDAGVLGRRLRGLPRAAPGPRPLDGGRARAGDPPPGREPLAVPPARDLRRDHLALAGRVRARAPRRAADRPQLVLRPCRDHHAAQHRPDRRPRRRHRHPASHGLPGRIFRRALRRRGDGGHAADPGHARCRPAGRRRHRCHPRRQLQSLGLALVAGQRPHRRRRWRCTRPPTGSTARQALRLWTEGSAWFSSEAGRKGRIAQGQLADLVVLSEDYMTVDEPRIRHIESRC